MLNDNTAPPKKPTTLSDVSNMEILDRCTEMVMSEAKIDMGIISNTVAIEARFDKVDSDAQTLFANLKKLLEVEQSGVRARIQEGYDRCVNYVQESMTNGTHHLWPAIGQIGGALIQMALQYQQVMEILVRTANTIGLDVVDEPLGWSLAANESRIGDFQTVVATANQMTERHSIPFLVGPDDQDYADLLDAMCLNMQAKYGSLDTSLNERGTIHPLFQQTMAIYFGNNQLGNVQVLEQLEDICTQAGIQPTPRGLHPTVNIGIITRYCHVYSKYAYNIAIHIEQYNNGQIRSVSEVQSEIPMSWCWQNIRSIPEFDAMGWRKRKTLARTLHRSSTSGDGMDRGSLAYLSDESFERLNLVAMDTNAQLEHSRMFLRAPQENHEILGQCFKPDMNHMVKLRKLFNLVPKPSFTKKYIKLEFPTLKTILNHLKLGALVKDKTTLEQVLDLSCIKGKNGKTFAKYVMTDGMAATVPFTKKAPSADNLPNLEPSDFEPWEHEYLNIWGADPGLKSIFVAVNGSDDPYTEESDCKYRAPYGIKCLMVFSTF